MTALPYGPPHDARAIDRWTRVVDAVGARQVGQGRAEMRCPVHEGDKRSGFAISLGDTVDFPLLRCRTSCDSDADGWYSEARAALVALGAPEDALQPAKGGGAGQRPSAAGPARRVAAPPAAPVLPTEQQVDAWHEALMSDRMMRRVIKSKWCTTDEALALADVGWDAQQGRYTFPVRNAAGDVVQMIYRDLRDDRPEGVPKSKTHKGVTGSHLYAPFGIAEGRRVVLCAGEKDAFAAHGVGLNAVSVTNGEHAAPSSERLAVLRGAEVVIAYDNDASGRIGARTIAAAVAEVASKVWVADLAVVPGLPNKGDLADVIARTGGEALLRSVLLAAVPWEGRRDEGASDGPRLFTRVSARDLAADPPKMTWAAQGLLVDPTYGVIAGEQKTLKTYLALFIALGVASGTSVLGEFAVVKQRPVHLYVGEGGRVPFQRRLHRVAEGLGLDVSRLPFSASFQTAPLLSSEFQGTLARDLDDLGSDALFILDPLYAFHGSEVDAGNLYKRGAMLTAFSAPVAEAGASALLVDHFTKTGSGTDLNRIQQTGVQQWADTWVLLRHRAAPDVEAGAFSLGVTVGSRQWGGAEWSLDLNLGRLDPDLGQHDGTVSWDLRRGHEADQRGSKTSDAAQKATEFLRSRLRDEPWQHTKTELEDLCGGNAPKFREAWDMGVADGLIQGCVVKRVPPNGKRNVARTVWAKAGEPLPDDAESSDV